VSSRITKYLDEQVRCSVDHKRDTVEIWIRIYEAAQAEAAIHSIDIAAACRAKTSQQIERSNARRLLSIFDRMIAWNFSDDRGLTIKLINLTGEINSEAVNNIRQVVCARSRDIRQRETQLDQAI
jgi:hypothetical protein